MSYDVLQSRTSDLNSRYVTFTHSSTRAFEESTEESTDRFDK